MKKKFTVGEEEIEVDVSLSTTCRCGQPVDFGMATLPEREIPVAIHEEPRCEVYVRLDLLDYMRWLRTGVEHMH